MPRKNERRCLRSDDTRTALAYQLAFSAVESGMEGLVLADDQGLLVASSPSTRRPEEIAAYGPLVLDPELLQPDCELAQRDDVSVQCFEHDGSRLFLVGLGGIVSHRALVLTRAMRGVCRILRRTTCVPPPPIASSLASA
ncbi:MAG: hypothetical protein JXB32_00015 [Deltaproteobacteria bacterium]|nr:hypothetical protein [Deltaproteobacteria bacterium]